jgi:hypothetical protein
MSGPTTKLTQNSLVKFVIPIEHDSEELMAEKGNPLSACMQATFAAIDTELSKEKSVMDTLDTKKLSSVLRAVDLYATLRTTVKQEFQGQIVTNAWLKMYEILAHFGVPEPLTERKIRAFCNAELPGAFISALNHYSATIHKQSIDWTASSLYPSTEDNTSTRSGILGDQYGLYEHNKDRWLMDENMRGDITDATQIRQLVERVKIANGLTSDSGGKVDIYTSDAGVDVTSDYNRQEELTAHINLGQIVTGLLCLREGGMLVTKTFTFTHPYSIAVIAVCASAFEEFHIVKPTTSRPTNSEVYFVGLNFLGLTSKVENSLLDAVENFDFAKEIVSLGSERLRPTIIAISQAARHLHRLQQVAFLKEAVSFYYRLHSSTVLRKNLARTASRVQREWLQTNPLSVLSLDEYLAMR